MELATIRELLTVTGLLFGGVGAICAFYYTFNSTKRKAEYLSARVEVLEKKITLAESDICLLKHVDNSLKESMNEIKQDLKDIKNMLIGGVR